MSFIEQNIVNFAIFQPLASAVLVALLPAKEERQVRVWTFLALLLNFGISVWMYSLFVPKGPEFQLETHLRWLPELGMSFHTGVDGLAVSLMLLTGFLGPLLVLASWTYIHHRIKEFHIALLVIQCAMMGALGSLDIILFYVFFEAMLIPMYLLIGVWGAEERQLAAVKFFLYTLFGSLLMLVAILAIYFISQPVGARSFDYASVYNALIGANREIAQCRLNAATCANLTPLALTLKTYGPYMFAAFALAFAIKVPMFPVHTWLPDAHVQAPVAGSMVLAGVMLKMGTFGFWRFAIPLFPNAAYAWRPALSVLAVIGIVYGALMCLAQQDIKKLIAYSSVSHLGYCMLGMLAMTSEGASGSAYQMLNHGISTGALFLLFGFLYERRHTRLMSEYGGIAKVMPVFTAAFLIITFSSVAVPGTNGFIGEFLVLLGAFKASNYSVYFGVGGAVGVILGATYMLWMVQRVFFGPLTQAPNLKLKDLSWREGLTALPFLILVLVMGVMPQPFLDVLRPSSDRFVARANMVTLAGVGNVAEDQKLRMEVKPLELDLAPVLPGVPQAAPPRMLMPSAEVVPLPPIPAAPGIPPLLAKP